MDHTNNIMKFSPTPTNKTFIKSFNIFKCLWSISTYDIYKNIKLSRIFINKF